MNQPSEPQSDFERLDDPTHDSASQMAKNHPPHRFQIQISTALLIMAAISSWLAYWAFQRETQKLERQLPSLRDAARELQVKDDQQITVVQRQPRWYAETIWDLQLPTKPRYQIALATKKISQTGLTEPTEARMLPSGRHSIEVRTTKLPDGNNQVSVLLDGNTYLESVQPKDWAPGMGTSGGSRVSENTEFDAYDPLVLFREVFMMPVPGGGAKLPQGPSNGVMVWIEPME